MRHRRVVPLFAVPNLIHGTGRITSCWRVVQANAGRYFPTVSLHIVDEDFHLLRRLIDNDEDLGRRWLGRFCSLFCRPASRGWLRLRLGGGGALLGIWSLERLSARVGA